MRDTEFMAQLLARYLAARSRAAGLVPEHGVRQVQIPWALPGARFTLPFESYAIDTLLEADVLGASRLLKLSWDEAWHVMERAVARGRKAKKRRVISLLGIDEKAFSTPFTLFTSNVQQDSSACRTHTRPSLTGCWFAMARATWSLSI
jgi:hypothetical protein